MVFGDASLIAMAVKQPKNEEEFLEIHGVGRKKLENYGTVFLKAMADFAVE